MFVGIRSINKNFIGMYLLAAFVLLAAAELAFGISGDFSEALGRGSGPIGKNSALDSPSRIAYQSDFWDGI